MVGQEVIDVGALEFLHDRLFGVLEREVQPVFGYPPSLAHRLRQVRRLDFTSRSQAHTTLDHLLVDAINLRPHPYEFSRRMGSASALLISISPR